MKKFLLSISLLLVLVAFPAPVRASEKVILDSDMVEGFDDGVAMVLLALNPDIELLGVTTVAGNTWVAEGTAYAIRQLELVDRTDIPVHQGLTRPLRPGRAEQIEHEQALMGAGASQYIGAMAREDPDDWRAVYRRVYDCEPKAAPAEGHAVNFIIDTVRKHPGEVSLVAIGPLSNVALAVRMAPDIVPLVKRIVYMGGSFFQPGNTTPAAEFNWWFDPEAAKIVVRMPFKEQIAFGLDVCEKVAFTPGHYQAFMDMLGESRLNECIRNSTVGRFFASNPKSIHYVWDVLTAASIVEPSLVLSLDDYYVDVVDVYSPSYGQSLAFPKRGPVGAQKMTIVTGINRDRFWELMLDKRNWVFPEPAK